MTILPVGPSDPISGIRCLMKSDVEEEVVQATMRAVEEEREGGGERS
jgi:hypothetical protein